MTRTLGQIQELFEARKARLMPYHAQAAAIRQTILGDTVLPITERDETQRPAVANLMLQGLEQKAMRVASTMPTVWYPPLSEKTDVAMERARDRIAVNRYWWQKNRMSQLLQKRARHLSGYAMSPVVVRFDPKTRLPQWHVRDPLSTYAPETAVGEIHPPDCIFAYPRPLQWLNATYPDQAKLLNKSPKQQDDDLYTLLEYVDADEYVLAVVGKASGPSEPSSGGAAIVELERTPNLVGMPLAVVPGRINLDRPQGEFDGMVGMFQLQARLMAMELIGVERSIFPETWLVSAPGGATPEIVVQADPHSGVTGIVKDGNITQFTPNPATMGLQAIDRLERGQRLEGGIPADFGGESASNIRTGRRGDAVLSNTIDFSIQSAQQTLEESMQVENTIAVNIDKHYAKDRKTIWVGRGSLTYEPAQLWETDYNEVRYAHAGVDANGLVIEGGQRIGIGTLSKRGFMELDPLIDDPEQELERITAEALRAAALGGIQQLVGSDPNQIDVAVRLIKRVTGDHVTIEDAWQQVHQEIQAQQQQAQQGQMPPEQMQPGATAPGMPQIGPPAPSVDNMHMLLRELRA